MFFPHTVMVLVDTTSIHDICPGEYIPLKPMITPNRAPIGSLGPYTIVRYSRIPQSIDTGLRRSK